MAALAIVFRFMVAHPEKLRRRKTGQCRIGRDVHQLFSTDGPGDFDAFFPRPLVTPDDSRPNDFVLFI